MGNGMTKVDEYKGYTVYLGPSFYFVASCDDAIEKRDGQVTADTMQKVRDRIDTIRRDEARTKAKTLDIPVMVREQDRVTKHKVTGIHRGHGTITLKPRPNSSMSYGKSAYVDHPAVQRWLQLEQLIDGISGGIRHHLHKCSVPGQPVRTTQLTDEEYEKAAATLEQAVEQAREYADQLPDLPDLPDLPEAYRKLDEDRVKIKFD